MRDGPMRSPKKKKRRSAETALSMLNGKILPLAAVIATLQAKAFHAPVRGFPGSVAAELQRSGRTMRSDEIRQARDKLPLRVLMHRLGLGDHAKKSARCPFHEDKHNSFSVWQSDGSWFWKCHAGCGEGDEITFLELLKRISRREAIKLFLETAGVEQTISQLPPQKATSETSKLELARVR